MNTAQHPDEALQLLLIEDDLIDRKTVERSLRRAQLEFELTAMENIRSGLEALRHTQFDCVLLDWHLPDESGERFLEEVARTNPELPVIVLTGSDDKEQVRCAMTQGAQDYLLKGSFDSSTIVRSIFYAIERKRSEKLRARIVKVERLRSIGQLAAGVAHEINNPAGWITANLEFMGDLLGSPDEAGRVQLGQAQVQDFGELIGECRQGIERIGEIVRSLRIYAEASRKKIEPVDLNEVVKQAASLLKSQLRPHALVVLELAHGLPAILGDQSALTQALVLALGNSVQAIKARPGRQEHKILISTHLEADSVRLLIEDTGEGVPEALRFKVFEPFFSTRPDLGTGMGLAVVHDVVSQHHGSARFLSEHEPGGARLELTFPCKPGLVLAAPPDEPTDVTVQALTPLIDEVLHILLIDDEAQVRRMFTRLLSERHDLKVAQSVQDASSILLESKPFDGVLINLLRLDSQARELLSVLQGCSASVVVCVGGANPSDLTRRFIRQTQARILHTPFELGDLQELLQHWAYHRELRSS